MTVMNTYLNFPGNAEEAFNFYKSIFGGEFAMLMRYKDGPPMEGQGPLPAELGEKILHVSLPMGKNMLMASDTIESLCNGATLVTGSNVSISLHPDSEAEGRRLFDALSSGGKVQMAYQPMFWGAVYGMCSDKFGIQWMVNYETPKS